MFYTIKTYNFNIMKNLMLSDLIFYHYLNKYYYFFVAYLIIHFVNQYFNIINPLINNKFITLNMDFDSRIV